MRLNELENYMRDLNAKGFIQTRRKGPTGIGYTLESWLNVPENNLPIPDIGGRVEIKATRSSANSLITLFTFNRGAWNHPQAEVIKKWGYFDHKKKRPALYTTVSASGVNSLGLQLILPENNEIVSIIHVPTGQEIATWDLYHMIGKFMAKFERLLLVHANSRKTMGIEEFHYYSALLLTDPSARTFRKGFTSGKVLIDIRMHLNDNTVRNRGTGFRIRENDLPNLFGRIRKIL